MLRVLLLSVYLFLLATLTLTAGNGGECPCLDTLKNKLGAEITVEAKDCLPNERTHYTVDPTDRNAVRTNDTVVLRFDSTSITYANKFVDSVYNNILTSTVVVVGLLTDIKDEREYRKNKILILIFSILLVVTLLSILYGYYTNNRLLIIVGGMMFCIACVVMAISIATCISLS